MKKLKLVPTVFGVAFVALAAFGGFYFKKYQDLKNNPPDATVAAQAENSRVIEAVGKLYKLPEGEEPTIFTVVDTEKLKQQYPALSAAEKDDKVILYTNAKIALVYRERDNKIVSVVNVTISQKTAVRLVGPQALRDAAKQTLAAKFAETIEIKSEADAKSTPPNTVVADLNGQAAELATQLAAALGGTAAVGTLPEGEEKPTDATIVIVLVQPQATPPVSPF